MMIGYPVVIDGAGPVGSPASSSVALAGPMALQPVLIQQACGTAQGDMFVPDAKHQTCYLLDAPFLTVSHLDAITVLPQDGTPFWEIDLKLTPTDSLILDNWTADNIGTAFAMVSAGIAVAQPTVQGALSTDEMLLTGPFSKADATTIRQQITGK